MFSIIFYKDSSLYSTLYLCVFGVHLMQVYLYTYKYTNTTYIYSGLDNLGLGSYYLTATITRHSQWKSTWHTIGTPIFATYMAIHDSFKSYTKGTKYNTKIGSIKYNGNSIFAHK